MAASVRLVDVLAGVIVTCPRSEPRPMVWFDPGKPSCPLRPVVLYSESQSK
jgi:hypothetical protein